jgi:uncharacterized protein YdhG (YjbR/CyaY superfamily)
MKNPAPGNIDAYIGRFTPGVQKILERIRLTVREAAPGASETISYGMPAFKYKGNILIYFAGYKNHIGLYATPSGHKAFEKELSKYKQGKGSVQFPIDKPMPLELISRIVKFRIQLQENASDLPSSLAAPVRRALVNNGIKTLRQLSKYTEPEVLKFLGVGDNAIQVLQNALREKGLNFKEK